MERELVLIDTDIGSDIDDALALAYLLKHPRCDLLGITTVTGDVQKRAALAEAVCLAAGRTEIGIHCGRRDVLVHGPGQPDVPQYEAIAADGLSLSRPENTAVEFLRHRIRERPGEITLLTIGPYSNVALLLALDPEIPFLLKSLVSMAGVFFQGENSEWNCRCDPTATSIVYGSKRAKHISVGLDVTYRCQMGQDEIRSCFSTEPLKTVGRMAEAWFPSGGSVTFHDPLAAALIFNPALCSYKTGKVAASPEGSTVLIEGEGPDTVAEHVDAYAFFKEFFSVTCPPLYG